MASTQWRLVKRHPGSTWGVPATEKGISRDPDDRAWLKVERDVPVKTGDMGYTAYEDIGYTFQVGS